MSTRLPSVLAALLALVLLAEAAVLWSTRLGPARDPERALPLFAGSCLLFDHPVQFFDPLVLGGERLRPAVRAAVLESERFDRETRSRMALWLGMQRDVDALPALERLARDASDPTVLRGDALHAIAVIDPEFGRALRAELAADPATPGLVLRAIDDLDQQDAAGGVWIWERGWWDALLGTRLPEPEP